MGLFNKWKKVRDKYLRQWGGIIDKYELNIPQNKYYHIATALGKAEGKSWLQRFVEGVFSGNIFSILGAIASIVTGGVLGLLAGALTLAQNVYTAVIGEKSAKLATALNAVQSHTSLLKEKQEVYSTGDKITEYIVYTDYEIYANVFKRVEFKNYRLDCVNGFVGAGNEIRTRDPNLGKVVLYP